MPTETLWFHGTRVPRDTDFSEGLLPLADRLPVLEAEIEGLALELGLPSERLRQGEVNPSYGAKLGLVGKTGPNGCLLRESVLRPVGAQRNYLDSPESSKTSHTTSGEMRENSF